MKYIDAEKLKELLGAKYKEFREKGYREDATYYYFADGLDVAKQLVESLQQEQTEIDLEEEMISYYNEHFSPCENGVLLSEESGRELDCNDYESIANHFYELGLKARNEKN